MWGLYIYVYIFRKRQFQLLYISCVHIEDFSFVFIQLFISRFNVGDVKVLVDDICLEPLSLFVYNYKVVVLYIFYSTSYLSKMNHIFLIVQSFRVGLWSCYDPSLLSTLFSTHFINSAIRIRHRMLDSFFISMNIYDISF